ncbi:MAG: TetR/AcrR family transcriptional regulator [Hyphomicrobiales bacterium]|nr:TetR/AcrR family transcriptional regulator [Hyphomicrobiales bacterium]
MPSDTESGPKRRGRPRGFVPEEALEKMTPVFARNGFDAASLDDLGAAAGLNRPSLYAAFGDKTELFIGALRRYAERQTSDWISVLIRTEPIEERLTAVFRDAVAAYCAAPDRPGCLLRVIATAAASGHPRIAAAASAARRRQDDMFEAAFARCVAARELPGDPPPATRARLAMAVLDTLSLRARLGEPPDDLTSFAQDSLALVCRI